MGNSQSSDEPSSTAGKSPSVSSASRSTRGRESSTRRTPSSSHGSHATKAPAVAASSTSSSTPPLPHLVPSTSAVSTETSRTHAQATVSASPASSQHSRARSITSASTPSYPSHTTAVESPERMGNAESRQQQSQKPDRANTLPPPSSDKAAARTPSPSSQPVDVPQQPVPHHDGLYEQDAMVYETVNSPLSSGLPPSDFHRPPRLPLPIERDPEPSSPIASPKDPATPVDATEDGQLKRRASMLSSTTLDDEEAADIENFQLDSDPYAQKVQTTIEYYGEGKAVYVTGTFALWEKKFRMSKGPEKDGKAVFTLSAALPTGTHHIKFLVDGYMVLSDQYPTTVDFTNSLVNYVEIAPPMPSAADNVPAPAVPMPIPGKSGGQGEEGKALPIRGSMDARGAEAEAEMSSTLHETVAPAPDASTSSASHREQGPQEEHQQRQQRPPPKPRAPRPKYTNQIPEVMLHLDLFNNPDDERYRRASKAIGHLPQPPSLPMFMSKSILNATTPHKDDASVLTMPNHTILNHLATSSIRNGVLATSGTTRYKRKFLTTIMYKPTSDDG